MNNNTGAPISEQSQSIDLIYSSFSTCRRPVDPQQPAAPSVCSTWNHRTDHHQQSVKKKGSSPEISTPSAKLFMYYSWFPQPTELLPSFAASVYPLFLADYLFVLLKCSVCSRVPSTTPATLALIVDTGSGNLCSSRPWFTWCNFIPQHRVRS